MHFFLESFVVVVFCLAAFLLAFLIILNLYLIKRNGFYVSVNCWFCNEWTKVAYEDRNHFDCPSCLQYNGFKEDGSYNKVIKAQYDTSFTKYSTQEAENYENGLCTYCNNNQQLKVYQLAKFVPINEENYDLEIEHFQKQLEKAYKLCKKCEKVLKTTINQQHAWLFGNRLKDIRKRGVSLLKLAKKEIENKNSYFLRLLRLILIVLNIIILFHILNIRIVYPKLNLNKILPIGGFNPYKVLLVDFYNTISNSFNEYRSGLESLKTYMPKDVKIQTNIMSYTTIFGCFLDLVLSIGQRRTFWWKANGLISWALLFVAFSLNFSDYFMVYIISTKLFASLTLLCYYIWFTSIETTNTTDYKFKKLSKSENNVETSDEETDEEMLRSFNNSQRLKTTPPKSTRTSPRSYRAYSPLIQQVTAAKSFTAKSVTSTSDLYHSSSSNELNRSLDNLHLTSLGHKFERCTSPIFSVSSVNKRPILSPAKLRNITQNPWTAGGFWKNDANVFSANIGSTNLSRSSSQSSGFGSAHDNLNHPFSSLPVSREPSITSEGDRVSILSEPAYHFTPINPPTTLGSPKPSVLYYKADNNTFYPVLSQDNMLFIQNGIPQQSFCKSSLRNFDTKSVTANSLFSEKPISPLFKNIQVSGNFRKPHF